MGYSWGIRQKTLTGAHKEIFQDKQNFREIPSETINREESSMTTLRAIPGETVQNTPSIPFLAMNF